jgi:hypothetical protein
MRYKTPPEKRLFSGYELMVQQNQTGITLETHHARFYLNSEQSSLGLLEKGG